MDMFSSSKIISLCFFCHFVAPAAFAIAIAITVVFVVLVVTMVVESIGRRRSYKRDHTILDSFGCDEDGIDSGVAITAHRLFGKLVILEGAWMFARKHVLGAVEDTIRLYWTVEWLAAVLEHL